MSGANGHQVPYIEIVRRLAVDVPTPGPWAHQRLDDGSLVLYDLDGEPVALIYGGLPMARYLEAIAPATLFGGKGGPA